VASVVFMRAVNVGGHQAFRPSALATALKGLEVLSIGAAGTFIVRAAADEGRIRREFGKHLSFTPQLMIRPAKELLALVSADPFGDPTLPEAEAQYITVIEKRPRPLPPCPLYVPDRGDWQIVLTAIHGHFAATVRRTTKRPPLYPNEVIEKRLGVAATTRGWPTILKIAEALGRTGL
jgi:uncharacterized protein (DUF1697 family)